MKSYESILGLVSTLKRSGADGERDLRWVHDESVVAAARTADGAVEIFLAGDELVASTTAVRKSIQHEQWHRKNGEPLAASRLVLPKAGHFDQVAAFICTELLRNGAALDLQAAFTKTEAVIALAIESLSEDDSWLRGLLGEVLFLEALIRNVRGDQIAAAVDGWNGHDMSLRDFRYGPSGVEVKTTMRKASSHMIEGVHQVELQGSSDDNGAQDEEALVLLSIGIAWSPAGGDDSTARSLPDLLDAVIARCQEALNETEAARVVEDLLARVSTYGASARNYDHGSMKNDPFFAKRFTLEFARGYDMLDPGIQVLRSDDVANRPNTVEGSVRFRINLPETVDGDINPVVGLNAVAKRIALSVE